MKRLVWIPAEKSCRPGVGLWLLSFVHAGLVSVAVALPTVEPVDAWLATGASVTDVHREQSARREVRSRSAMSIPLKRVWNLVDPFLGMKSVRGE